MLIEIENETEWLKIPADTFLTFVGRDTVVVGKGCYLMFFNFPSGQTSIYSAYNYDHGEGVECYCGHRNIPVLAFAEKILNPRLIIISYPEFTKLKCIENGAPEGYTVLSFSEQTYLVSLSALPEFEITIWNWRTTEKLYSSPTKLTQLRQHLLIHHPVSICQYAENSNLFLVWNIHNSYKKCLAIKRKIYLPNNETILSSQWSTDDTLYILTSKGSVYQVQPDYTVEMIICDNTSGTCRPCFHQFKGGFIIQFTNLETKYYKKCAGIWIPEWTVTPCNLRQIKACSPKDLVVGWSNHAEIMELDLQKHTFFVRKYCETTSHTFCFIYPLCNYFASLITYDETVIKFWECITGNEVGQINVEGNTCTIVSNPVYPYIAAGLTNGYLILINCINAERPKILTSFHLYEHEISQIYFNSIGDIIVTANLALGLFFVISGTPGSTMKILHYINYRRPTISISVTEDEKYINLYLLVHTDTSYPASNRIVVKSISKKSNTIKKKKYICENNEFTYLEAIDDQLFLAKIWDSKMICTVNFLKKNINIVNEMHSGHYLRYYALKSTNQHVYTFGYDGLVIIRNKKLEFVGSILIHHRYTGGVENIIIDPFLRFSISYGTTSHELIYSKFLQKTVDDRVKETVKKVTEMRSLFSDITVGFIKCGPDGNSINYLKYRQLQIIEQEKILYKDERDAIMEEFNAIKKEVIDLLDKNLHGPELEKIDILEFYLHTLLKQHKEEINKKKCDWVVKYYKDLIKAQDAVTAVMKKRFYDTMEIVGTVISGIFSNFSVESYSISLGSAQYIYDAKIATMYREFENILRTADFFKPWENLPDNVIQQKLGIPPAISIKSESVRIKEVLDDIDIEDEYSVTNLTNNLVCYPCHSVGMFIEPNKLLYDQEEIHTYIQLIYQLKLIENDQVIIRKLFNDKYEEMKQQKIRDMNLITEKNNRLRFILSELGITQIEIDDPIWHTSEHIENIITTKDSEIGVSPYISPSAQALIDWQLAEDERIRLLLLADDFRERALIKMMDGVLEIRWEDTLKREIPKPKCMLEKDPMTFNEEDMRAIKDYEEKVAFLNSERLMYKNMLETEYLKTAEQVREMIKKFNGKLRDLLLYKIKIESARLQQSFIINRLQYDSIVRWFAIYEKNNVVTQIKHNTKFIKKNQQSAAVLIDAYAECKSVGDSFAAKDKILDRNFRREFIDYSSLIQEQVYRLYRKPPKLSFKSINNIGLLNELANCVVTQEKSVLLNQDCIDYLKSLDILDQYVGVPNTIDESMYKIVCKHRRLRTENDLRIKVISLEQQDIEIAMNAFQKFLTTQKEVEANLIKLLDEKQQGILEHVHNKKMQIVIKRGLVEIPITGNMNDFDDAILISRNDVENVNKIILEAGALKLQVMTNTMIHRRGILIKEWEHKKMKMEIEDLNVHIHNIEQIKVTKEIQQFLRQRAKGESFDKGALTLDQEIESQKKSYEKIIYERQCSVNELDKQIQEYKIKNKTLDKDIAEVNVDVCEKQVNRDLEFEKKYKTDVKQRMAAIVKRANLAKKIQDQHNEILVLQTELELLRLKTYPTLKFKTLF